MTRYTDKDGGVSFDDETVARLAKMAAEVESGFVPSVCVSALNREELWECFFGSSAEILSTLRHVNASDPE